MIDPSGDWKIYPASDKQKNYLWMATKDWGWKNRYEFIKWTQAPERTKGELSRLIDLCEGTNNDDFLISQFEKAMKGGEHDKNKNQ